MHTILWHRLDTAGHESAQLIQQADAWLLTGTALFAHEKQPCRLNYQIHCDRDWKTISAAVNGWIGNQVIILDIAAGSHWRINDKMYAIDCMDIDLNFSPSTNLLPIRRLNLPIGGEATVTAAWLRFPSFELEPLVQVYRRIDSGTYHYESAGGSFVAELKVNQTGFVTLYPKFWQGVAHS